MFVLQSYYQISSCHVFVVYLILELLCYENYCMYLLYIISFSYIHDVSLFDCLYVISLFIFIHCISVNVYVYVSVDVSVYVTVAVLC